MARFSWMFVIRTGALSRSRPNLPFIHHITSEICWLSRKARAQVVDCGDGVVGLVIADQVDLLLLLVKHKRYNLPWAFHERWLAIAVEFNLTGWVNQPDHRACLSIEDDTVVDGPPVVSLSSQDADIFGVQLGEDWAHPRVEVWDFY